MIGAPESTEAVYLLLEHLAANGRAQLGEPGDPAYVTFTGKSLETSIPG